MYNQKRWGRDSTATFPGQPPCILKKEKGQLKRVWTSFQHFPISLLRWVPKHSAITTVIPLLRPLSVSISEGASSRTLALWITLQLKLQEGSIQQRWSSLWIPFLQSFMPAPLWNMLTWFHHNSLIEISMQFSCILHGSGLVTLIS